MDKSKEYIELEEEFSRVMAELQEANEVIHAIRSGEVDALVVNGKDGHQLFTLKSADQTYRIFIEQMTESAFTLDRDNRILYCNSQFAKLIGLPLEKVIGLYFPDFVVAEDKVFAVETISCAWEIDTKAELKLLHQDNEVIPVQISLKALSLDEGESLSVVITDLKALKLSESLLQTRNKELEQARAEAVALNDNLELTVKERTKALEANIAEKTKIEEVLRSNEERLTSILQTMGEGLCILDGKGQVTFANKKARQIFALNSEEILKCNFFTLQQECFDLDGTQIEKENHPIAELIVNQHAVFDREIRIKNRNNELVYISINATPLFTKGHFSGAVMTFTDVSNKRKIALQKDEFISVASHEIKTPLTSLKASMQLLTRMMEISPDSEKIPVLIQKANLNLAKVVHLADDLMNVSKIQHGPLPLDKEMVDISAIVQTCADQVLHHSNIKLSMHGAIGAKVLADQQRIEQVLVNLFNNAVKYAPETPEIKVGIAVESEFLKVSVQDFGNGIAPEKLPHLFDRYYQVNPQGTQVSGLGLGLYISNEIIQRHGGKLTVESKAGVGTTFFFTIPIS